ncbi:MULTISPECIES: glycosyltransferase family 4 protein [unclassified Mycobacterium]|uniref:glycosyltransferase family 4 protein n=1 Tax=unclassified Mycobacterium TaxID=2642494 RepID=UPI0004906A8C|nr:MULTISPECIES: glycosyltransferase family 4 protein [unclassified Mycobacterium]SEB24240.1 Glycosyltransferase involved in cell wall bisynthesis [Mycobacterium sp. 283mftsu]
MTSDPRAPLRIGMVTTRALPLMGGIETHVHEVSRRLATAGLEVTVVTTDPIGDQLADDSLSGYRIRRFPAYPRSRDYYLSPGLYQHLMHGDYDIVHVQGVHSLVAPTALAATRRAGVRSILTFHTGGHPSALRASLRPLQWRLMAPLLRSAAAFAAVSEYERRLFAKVLGIEENTIRLIRNGCEPLPVDPTAESMTGSPLILSVGRLERHKGHQRILRALPNILDQAPDARLVLVGSGPYESRLRTMAGELDVAERVSICSFGPDRRSSMGKLISDADVVCLMSECEAHPVAIMEAVGAGTPALVADTSGLSELGRAGLVTTIPLDAPPAQLAAATLAVAATPRSDPPALPTWNDCADELHRLYLEVAGLG